MGSSTEGLELSLQDIQGIQEKTIYITENGMAQGQVGLMVLLKISPEG